MKEFNKDKLKKQIVSGGIYIALAAAVVTVTMNGVNNIIGSTEDYEIPDVNLDLPEIDSNIIFEQTEIINSEKDIPDIAIESTDQNNDVPFVENKNSDITDFDKSQKTEDKDEKSDIIDDNISTPSNSMTEGVSSALISGEPNEVSAPNVSGIQASGEPDDIEYPTEPDPVSYEIYAKPAEGYIDKEYSDDELIYSVTMGDYRTHNGIDITGDPGSAVKAINAGVVEDIYFDSFYGYTVKINHGDGIVAYYMNLSEDLPSGLVKGTKVSHGQIIGGIGNSAAVESAEVSHLHLSITVNGKYVDPREILRESV